MLSSQGTTPQSLVRSVRQQWGYDVSGRVESEMIQGIFAELDNEGQTTADSPSGSGE